MFFVLAGALLAAPAILNKTNRWLTEVVIPRQDMRALQHRRAQQAAAGVPESKRETTYRMSCDAELTLEEAKRLSEMGAFDIIRRAQMRRPIVAKMETGQEVA